MHACICVLPKLRRKRPGAGGAAEKAGGQLATCAQPLMPPCVPERNSVLETNWVSFFGAVGVFLARLFSPVLTSRLPRGC